MPITRSPRYGIIASVTIPAGLVKLMTHASGASAAIRCSDRRRHRQRPQPVRDPAGADGLLTQYAEVERDPFVDRAPLEPADPDRREDEVRTPQGLVEVGRLGHHRRIGVPRGLLPQYGADRGERGTRSVS